MHVRMKMGLAALVVGLSACNSGDRPAPTPQHPASKAKKVNTQAIAPVNPSAKSTFKNVPECMKAKYTKEQCDRAFGTAQAMHQAEVPLYPTEGACKKFFLQCEKVQSRFAPTLTSFSIGNETPGQMKQPSPENPLWHAPLYASASNQLVYLRPDRMGQVLAIPVSNDPKLPPPEKSVIVGNVASASDRRAAFAPGPAAKSTPASTTNATNAISPGLKGVPRPANARPAGQGVPAASPPPTAPQAPAAPTAPAR